MKWTTPLFSRNQVNKVGDIFAKFYVNEIENMENLNQSLDIINNWRASHAYPLNTFQTTLRKRARQIDSRALVAQRTKRLESISSKLLRQTTKLSQMQDIGGCRAVLSNLGQARQLIALYENGRSSRFEHELKWKKNYIDEPKIDGYRGAHIIYSYVGRGVNKCYDGLRIEVQIRTTLQHAWATAVEAVGTFTKQALKSNQGSQDWLRFFTLAGAAVAFQERCNAVPNTPENRNALRHILAEFETRLRVINTLKAYSSALTYTNTASDAKYFLLKLDMRLRRVTITRFEEGRSKEANDRYIHLEATNASDPEVQIVLVSVDSLASLKKAYPNYFLDTERFVRFLGQFLYGS